MKLSILVVLVIFSDFYSQSENKSSHIIKYENFIKANVRTTITLVGADSTKFILFDNLLSKTQNIVFIHQPDYFNKMEDNIKKILLPFPILKSGQYTLEYFSTDTLFSYKFLYLE